jgi:hypothetical protein
VHQAPKAAPHCLPPSEHHTHSCALCRNLWACFVWMHVSASARVSLHAPCIPHCRLTLADIFCVAALFYPIKVVLTEEQRAAFPATMRCVVATLHLQCQEGLGCV